MMHGPIVPSLVFYIEKGDGRTDGQIIVAQSNYTYIYTYNSAAAAESRFVALICDVAPWFFTTSILLPGLLLLDLIGIYRFIRSVVCPLTAIVNDSRRKKGWITDYGEQR